MGKKSRRRTGKKERRTQKKAASAGGVENEANISSSANAPLVSLKEKEQKNANDFDRELQKANLDKEAFEQFMLWSLSEKANLTPKKFAKMAPQIARSLLDGQASTLTFILNSREKVINALEQRQLDDGIKLLMTRVHLGSNVDEAAFQEEVEELAERQKPYLDPLVNIFESFQKVAKKWTRVGYISLKYCLFYYMIRSNFRYVFKHIMAKFVKSIEVTESKDGKLFRKFFFHPSLQSSPIQKDKRLQKDKKDELQKLVVSVITLYQEMNTCWECKQIDGEALICASCKCAAYCSRECQVKHWREGKHKEHCKATHESWSKYERRKKRVGRAIYKDKRVYTKPIIVNGIEKECFLRPCAPYDYFLCDILHKVNNLASIDIFYKNMAKLACGGNHILFGNDTISDELEEKIRTNFKDVIFEFDPKSFTKEEFIAMKSILGKLLWKETELTKKDENRSNISIDRFLIIYICVEPLNIAKLQQVYDKFKFEADFLKGLRRAAIGYK